MHQSFHRLQNRLIETWLQEAFGGRAYRLVTAGQSATEDGRSTACRRAQGGLPIRDTADYQSALRPVRHYGRALQPTRESLGRRRSAEIKLGAAQGLCKNKSRAGDVTHRF